MRSKYLATTILSTIAAIITVFLASTWVRADSKSQLSNRNRSRLTRRASDQRTGANTMKHWSPIPSPALLSAANPAPVFYNVVPIPARGEDQFRTPRQDRDIQEAVKLINQLRPIPEDRIRFFSWMNADDSTLNFTGWWIFVKDATAIPGGWHITLQVCATAQFKDGGSANVNNVFLEEYRWADGNLQFLKGYPHPRLSSEPSVSTQ